MAESAQLPCTMKSSNQDAKKRKNDAEPNEHGDPDAWRAQMCKDLYEHVAKQLNCSWETDGGLCGLESCRKETGRWAPYRNGPERDRIGYHSDLAGVCLEGSIRITVSQPKTIVVCSPACYKRAKLLVSSSPTLCGEYGPIIRGTDFHSNDDVFTGN